LVLAGVTDSVGSELYSNFVRKERLPAARMQHDNRSLKGLTFRICLNRRSLSDAQDVWFRINRNLQKTSWALIHQKKTDRHW